MTIASRHLAARLGLGDDRFDCLRVPGKLLGVGGCLVADVGWQGFWASTTGSPNLGWPLLQQLPHPRLRVERAFADDLRFGQGHVAAVGAHPGPGCPVGAKR